LTLSTDTAAQRSDHRRRAISPFPKRSTRAHISQLTGSLTDRHPGEMPLCMESDTLRRDCGRLLIAQSMRRRSRRLARAFVVLAGSGVVVVDDDEVPSALASSSWCLPSRRASCVLGAACSPSLRWVPEAGLTRASSPPASARRPAAVAEDARVTGRPRVGAGALPGAPVPRSLSRRDTRGLGGDRAGRGYGGWFARARGRR
jgi:hypothetical protein